MPTHRVTLLCLTIGLTPSARAQVLTAQYNNARTSATLHEKILTPANVNARTFGKLFSLTTDGDVFAQPLYVPTLAIPGLGRRNVIFAATEPDSVYAIALNSPHDTPLWHTSFADPAHAITPLADRDVQCPFITPEVGITPTPVIDLATKTIYVLARTKEQGTFVQKLHALDITTGHERPDSPVVITASVPGTGDGSINGKVSFDPQKENPRAALLLLNGVVYLTWGSSCDVAPYHGWVMAYDARTLHQRAVLNTSPDGDDAGIWQSDAAPSSDEAGNIYLATGNGNFNAAQPNGRNYGDTLLKLHLDGPTLTLRDYFTPHNQKDLDAHDWDLGSQGPVLLGTQPGPHPHLLVIAGKEGKLYLLDRDQLGKFHQGSDPSVLQTIKIKDAYGAAATWNNNVYFTDRSDITRDFTLANGHLTEKSVTAPMPSPAATPIVSANGNTNAILWVASTKEWDETQINRPAILHAYDPTNLARELYSSEQNPTRDRGNNTVRFSIPTIADGHVILGTRDHLDIYGLLNHPAPAPK
jgi:hypothetical protein